MKRIQAFFITFTITLCVMLCMFGGLYFVVTGETRQAGTKQEGVLVTVLQPKDSKTVLCVFDGGEWNMYCLVKLNAIQNKVNVVAVPSDFYMDSADRTLAESMEYAGVRQCVQDLSEFFNIKISHHLVCDADTAQSLAEDLAAAESDMPVPSELEKYFAAGTLDWSGLAKAVKHGSESAENLEFFAAALCRLLEKNMGDMGAYLPAAIKKHYSRLNTDIGTMELSELEKIAASLAQEGVVYSHLAVKQDDGAKQAVDSELNG